MSTNTVSLADLPRLLGSTSAGIDAWTYLAPSIDRTVGTVDLDHAVLIALAVRLRQGGLATTAVRRVVARVLAGDTDDWIVVKEPRREPVVHVEAQIDLVRQSLAASALVVGAAELRARLAD